MALTLNVSTNPTAPFLLMFSYYNFLYFFVSSFSHLVLTYQKTRISIQLFKKRFHIFFKPTFLCAFVSATTYLLSCSFSHVMLLLSLNLSGESPHQDSDVELQKAYVNNHMLLNIISIMGQKELCMIPPSPSCLPS